MPTLKKLSFLAALGSVIAAPAFSWENKKLNEELFAATHSENNWSLTMFCIDGQWRANIITADTVPSPIQDSPNAHIFKFAYDSGVEVSIVAVSKRTFPDSAVSSIENNTSLDEEQRFKAINQMRNTKEYSLYFQRNEAELFVSNLKSSNLMGYGVFDETGTSKFKGYFNLSGSSDAIAKASCR